MLYDQHVSIRPVVNSSIPNSVGCSSPRGNPVSTMDHHFPACQHRDRSPSLIHIGLTSHPKLFYALLVT
jgi:hypothetical protein